MAITIIDGSIIDVTEPSMTIMVDKHENITEAEYANFVVKSYNQLADKPRINNIELVGNSTLSMLGIGSSQVNGAQLGGLNSGRQAVEVTNSGQNMCALMLKRGEMTMAIVIVDLWSTNIAVWGTLPAEVHFIRPSTSGNTNKFTIQNNISTSGSAIAFVGIGCKFGEVTTTDAEVAENFTRTVMDDFVPSSGGSFSGNVVHENANVYVDDGAIVSNTTPSANQYGKSVYFRDSNNVTLGAVNLASYTNGRQALRFVAQRVVNGSTLYHGLSLWIDASGNRGVTTDDAAAWRNGIGAAAYDHTHDYLPLSGGTLTGATTITGGNFSVKSPNIDETVTPSSAQGGTRVVAFTDKNSKYFGSIQPYKFANGGQGLRFQSRHTVDGVNVWNYLDIIVNSDGTYGVQVPSDAKEPWRNAIGAAASSHTHSYLPLSGGTLTGDELIKSSNLQSGVTPSSNQFGKGLRLTDKNDGLVGLVRFQQRTNGTDRIEILARKTSGGTNYDNSLYFGIDNNNNPVVEVTNAASWRTAIGAAASSHTHSAADVSSGTLDAARLPTITASKGGTGRTTLTSNAVLAGNGTGQVKQIATASGALYATAANGAAQFGALPVAQGGTGSTSAADARTALGIGEQLDDVVIADISLPSSNQTTILGTMTVPAGKWLLKGVAYFAANSTGDRKVYLGTGTSYANQRGCAVSSAAGSQVCIIEVMPIMTFTKNTVVNLIPYQSSGSALSTRGMISAVRLA